MNPLALSRSIKPTALLVANAEALGKLAGRYPVSAGQTLYRKQRLVLLGGQSGLDRSRLTENEKLAEKISKFSEPLVVRVGEIGPCAAGGLARHGLASADGMQHDIFISYRVAIDYCAASIVIVASSFRLDGLMHMSSSHPDT
jgi:hypothetical protein